MKAFAIPCAGAAAVSLGAAMLSMTGCDSADAQAAPVPGGDPVRGKAALVYYGCASCHVIPGVQGANGLVGPPLDRIASRGYVAGVLPNNPDNLLRWIKDPPAVDPLTAMPNTHLTDADARHIVSYLETLR